MDQIRRFFGVERMGSTLEREFIAGAVTFFSMSYIIVINRGCGQKPGLRQ